jgi:membrane-bound metal-dependent hydrolase YbcI (DUF457 family)
MLRLRSWEERGLLLIGAIMVDIERPFSLLVEFLGLNFLKLTRPFHSLLGVFLLSLTFREFFDSSDISQKKQFALIFIGGCLHLLLDMTLLPWQGKGVYLLYPLQISFNFDLFWPGSIVYPFLALLICLISLIWYFLWSLVNNWDKNNLFCVRNQK